MDVDQQILTQWEYQNTVIHFYFGTDLISVI